MRILLGFEEIAGYLTAIRTGLGELGLAATICDLGSGRWGYRQAEGRMERFARALARLRRDCRGRFARTACIAATSPLALWLLVWVSRRHRLAILTGFSCLISVRIDGMILRACGCRIIRVFLGSDIRPPFLNGIQVKELGVSDRSLLRQTRRLLRLLSQVEESGETLVNTQPQALLMRRRFVSFWAIGFPIRRVAIQRRFGDDHAAIRIVHAPTRPRIKGSAEIRRIIRTLIAEGRQITLIELIGVTNHRVLEALADADLVIDETHADAPLGGLGCEAAALGVPTIVSGWYAEQARRDLVQTGMPPGYYCLPPDLERTTRAAIDDLAALRAMGRRCQAFADTQWSAAAVSRRLIRAAVAPPQQWLTDPATLRYAWGYGLDPEEARTVAQRLATRWGRAALGLDHVPVIAATLLDDAPL